jgi:membrane protease YdiL (CAAX protease family)
MNSKAIAGYFLLLTLSSFLYAMKPSNHISYSSLPLLMLIFPIAVGYRVRINFSIKDISMGLIVSGLILLPYYFLIGGHHGKTLTVYSILFQILSVAFPEEFFFRGYLQNSMGRTLKAVLFVSLLFSLAHLPRAIFLSDWISLLSFFPSLIMGWLYVRAHNILPGTIFHFFANIVNLA